MNSAHSVYHSQPGISTIENCTGISNNKIRPCNHLASGDTALLLPKAFGLLFCYPYFFILNHFVSSFSCNRALLLSIFCQTFPKNVTVALAQNHISRLAFLSLLTESALLSSFFRRLGFFLQLIVTIEVCMEGIRDTNVLYNIPVFAIMKTVKD